MIVIKNRMKLMLNLEYRLRSCKEKNGVYQKHMLTKMELINLSLMILRIAIE